MIRFYSFIAGFVIVAACSGVFAGEDRDPRVYRSLEAKHAFQRQHPCPSTGKTYGRCPGWIKDHIRPLACGGPDAPSNMQWQTVEDARDKDKWERKGCER
jgi:hypothetical protein